MRWCRILVFTAIGLCGGGLGPALATERGSSGTTPSKIEPLVLQQLEGSGRADFFIRSVDKADLAPAFSLGASYPQGSLRIRTLSMSVSTVCGRTTRPLI